MNNQDLLKSLCNSAEYRINSNHKTYKKKSIEIDIRAEWEMTIKIDRKVIFKVLAITQNAENYQQIIDELSKRMIEDVFTSGLALTAKSLEDMDIVSYKGK